MSRAKQQTRFNVEVTEADIERAHRNDSYSCVVAQAIARTIPDATRIEVDVQAIRFTRGGERFVYLTPYVVQGYVVAFDAGEPIQSFGFQIRDPKRVARQRLTEAGKAIDRAGARARRRRKAAPVVPPAERTTDPEVESAKAAYEGQPRSTRTGPKPPPRVFKKKTRTYGHRDLRINQEAL